VILLDTNVVSALMQREPDRRVVAWLDDLPADLRHFQGLGLTLVDPWAERTG
jgi:predicted nucleic acid-binding protein